MTISGNLKSAFTFYRLRGYLAARAVEHARVDIEAGRKHYPATRPCPAVTWQDPRPIGNLPFPQYAKRGLGYVDKPANAGLRFVGDVQAEGNGWHGYWARNSRGNGWYADNESGSLNGTVYGVVYQLPGRDGKSRFVAGYRFSEHDGDGITIDLGTVYEEPAASYEPVRKTANGTLAGGYWNYQDSPQEMDAAHIAARAADSMAESAAEGERAYEAAWQAGSRWTEFSEAIVEHKAALKALLVERRAARTAGLTGYTAICDSIRTRARTLLVAISDARGTMKALAAGEYVSDWQPGFWAGDERLRAAFNEGAGESVI